MFELLGSAAVVTGAARGIGLAICEALARQGSRLTLLDADDDAVRAAANQLGPEHRAVCLDVTDHDALSGAILAAMGDIEGPAPGILVNNAAVVTTQAFDELTLVEWQKTLDINLTAAMIATRSAAAALRLPGGGRVINIASIAARLGGGLVGSSALCDLQGRTDRAHPSLRTRARPKRHHGERRSAGADRDPGSRRTLRGAQGATGQWRPIGVDLSDQTTWQPRSVSSLPQRRVVSVKLGEDQGVRERGAGSLALIGYGRSRGHSRSSSRGRIG